MNHFNLSRIYFAYTYINLTFIKPSELRFGVPISSPSISGKLTGVTVTFPAFLMAVKHVDSVNLFNYLQKQTYL